MGGRRNLNRLPNKVNSSVAKLNMQKKADANKVDQATVMSNQSALERSREMGRQHLQKWKSGLQRECLFLMIDEEAVGFKASGL